MKTSSQRKCIFEGIDILETKPYPLMRVWFKCEENSFCWIPKWQELYQILREAHKIEGENFKVSPWETILGDIKKDFEWSINKNSKE